MIDHFKGLTFISLQLIFGHSVCAAIKIFLQRVHLPAQDISEGLHLRQLLPQAVALLDRRRDGEGTGEFGKCYQGECAGMKSGTQTLAVCTDRMSKPRQTVGRKAHLEGGRGGGGVATGGRRERQHGAMSSQTGLGAIS